MSFLYCSIDFTLTREKQATCLFIKIGTENTAVWLMTLTLAKSFTHTHTCTYTLTRCLSLDLRNPNWTRVQPEFFLITFTHTCSCTHTPVTWLAVASRTRRFYSQSTPVTRTKVFQNCSSTSAKSRRVRLQPSSLWETVKDHDSSKEKGFLSVTVLCSIYTLESSLYRLHCFPSL